MLCCISVWRRTYQGRRDHGATGIWADLEGQEDFRGHTGSEGTPAWDDGRLRQLKECPVGCVARESAWELWVEDRMLWKFVV